MTAHELMCAARDRKAVVWGPNIRNPAAFIAHWQFWRVMDLLPTMHLYKPVKPKTTKKYEPK